MNKFQAITLLIAAANLLAMLLFPPYDFPSPYNGVPNFDGFQFVFSVQPDRVLNASLLSLELFIVLINATIALALLSDRVRLRRRLDRQKLVLVGIALNLLLALLFPPFQDHYVASHALLPSFDGFHFLFSDNSERVVVAAMLWFEVLFILMNGAIFWLLFCKPNAQGMTAAERFAQSADSVREDQRKYR